MAKRSRAEGRDQGTEGSRSAVVDDEAWDTPAFRRALLIDLFFVVLPAIVMAALGEHTIAAAWLGVGVLVVLLQFRRQIGSFWCSWRRKA